MNVALFLRVSTRSKSLISYGYALLTMTISTGYLSHIGSGRLLNKV